MLGVAFSLPDGSIIGGDWGGFFGWFGLGADGSLLAFSLTWLIISILVLAVAWIIILAMIEAVGYIKALAADEGEREKELAEISAQPGIFAAGDEANAAALRSLQNDGFNSGAAMSAMDAPPSWDNAPPVVDMSGWSESGAPRGMERW